jgi:hypothetical protein
MPTVALKQIRPNFGKPLGLGYTNPTKTDDRGSMIKNVNVTISNVIAWFEESEQCMLHNHAQKMIPTVALVDKNVTEDALTDFVE